MAAVAQEPIAQLDQSGPIRGEVTSSTLVRCLRGNAEVLPQPPQREKESGTH